MSDLSRDARDLIEQAKKDGPALLGPSARDRARVRDKLTPLWAANAPRPGAKGGWFFRLGTVLVIAGLAALGWSARPEGPRLATPPLAAAGHEAQSSTTLPLGLDGVTTLLPVAGADHASVHESAARERPAPHVSRQLPGKRVHAASGATAEAERSDRERAAPDERSTTYKSADEHSTSQAPRTDGALHAPTRGGVSVPLAEQAGEAALERTPLTAAAKAAHNSAAHSDMHPSPPSIDGELQLLSAAQSALQQQRPSRALNLLQEHAFRFPTGALSEERMALQALALCASGRKHAAQTVLSNLEARAVPSQLLPRVRSQCGL